MSLLQELQRRNVIRVATAYVVAAWLIVQVAETTFEAFEFGPETLRLVRAKAQAEQGYQRLRAYFYALALLGTEVGLGQSALELQRCDSARGGYL